MNTISAVNSDLNQNAFGYYVVDANDGANMALCNNGAIVAMFPINTDSGTILRTIAANTTDGRPTWGQEFKSATAWGAGLEAGQLGVAALGLGILSLFGGRD